MVCTWSGWLDDFVRWRSQTSLCHSAAAEVGGGGGGGWR